ncbi:MAG: hypothetical protein ACK5LF_24145 [Bacteroides xylanisolvens]
MIYSELNINQKINVKGSQENYTKVINPTIKKMKYRMRLAINDLHVNSYEASGLVRFFKQGMNLRFTH